MLVQVILSVANLLEIPNFQYAIFNYYCHPFLPGWEYVTYKNEGPSPRSGHSCVIVDNFLYMQVLLIHYTFGINDN